MSRWKYRNTDSSTLRATLAVLSKRPLCWLFADQLAAIEMELLARELPTLADESGGHLVEWVAGVQ